MLKDCTQHQVYTLCNAIVEDSVHIYARAKANILLGRGNQCKNEEDMKEAMNFINSEWFITICNLPRDVVKKACDDAADALAVRLSKGKYKAAADKNIADAGSVEMKKPIIIETTKGELKMKTINTNLETPDFLNLIVTAATEAPVDAREERVRKYLFTRLTEGVPNFSETTLINAITGKSLLCRTGKSSSKVSVKEAKKVVSDTITAFKKVGLI